MKIITTLLVLLSVHIQASPPVPPINEPRFVGVPAFEDSAWQTSPETSTTRSWHLGCCSSIESGSNIVFSNTSPLSGPGISSSVWINASNHFYQGLPLAHSLRFRWEADMAAGNWATCYVNGVAFTNVAVTATWVDVRLLIPPISGSSIQLRWTSRDNTPAIEANDVALDAVKWIQIDPSPPVTVMNTNFFILPITSNTFSLRWRTNYQGYNPMWKTNLTSPSWTLETSPIIFTGGLFRVTVTNVSPQRFYRLQYP